MKMRTVFALLCLLLCLTSWSVSADNGVTANFDQCVDLDNLGVFCVAFSLDTCQTFLYINITYNGDVVFSRLVNDLREAQSCWNPSGACSACLGFGELIVSPAYAHTCPQITTTCTILGRAFVGVTPLACLTFGQDCTQYKTCETCASSTCGWCGVTGECLSSGNPGPYCDSCQLSTWVHNDNSDCPKADSIKVNLVVGLTVGLVVGSLAIGGIVFFCVRYKRKTQVRTKRFSDANFNLDNEIHHEELRSDDSERSPANNSNSINNNNNNTNNKSTEKSNVQVHVDSTSPFEFLDGGK